MALIIARQLVIIERLKDIIYNLIQNQEAVGSCNDAGSKTVGCFVFAKYFCSLSKRGTASNERF